MRLLRRRPAAGLLDDERPEVADTIAATMVDDVDVVRARLDVLDARLAVLEHRFADADEAAVVLPDQGDVLDAQIRSARLSAELHLVAIELRAELQRLRGDWPADADASAAGTTPDTETVIELVNRLAAITADP
jgi:hypothetical protein